MNRSEEIADLAKALSVAQSQIEPPKKTETAEIQGKTKDGKFYKYKYSYSDLAGCWDAIRKPFGDNGLAVVQLPQVQGHEVTIETLLVHESGQWVSNSLTMHCASPDAQSLGSVITYGRRYGLMSLAGLAPEDDDGKAAMPRTEREAEALGRKVGAVPASRIPPPDEEFVKQVRDLSKTHETVASLDIYGGLIKAAAEEARISQSTYAASRAVLIERRRELLAAEAVVEENALAEQEA